MRVRTRGRQPRPNRRGRRMRCRRRPAASRRQAKPGTRWHAISNHLHSWLFQIQAKVKELEVEHAVVMLEVSEIVEVLEDMDL